MDNISREPHEFTHPVPAYQVLASQKNQEAEQTLGLVHSEQYFRNEKANMASTSTTAVDSDFDGNDFTYIDYEEEKEEGDAEWVNTPFFLVEHVLDEYKSQAMRAMKKPMIEDPVHKKLSSYVLDSIKLNKMQFISLKTSIKYVQEDVESAKEKQSTLFDQRLSTLTMLNMEKKLKEESQLANRIEKLEERVGTMEGTLKAILDESIHQSKILKNSQMITKRGRKMSLQVSLKLKYLNMLVVSQIQC